MRKKRITAVILSGLLLAQTLWCSGCGSAENRNTEKGITDEIMTEDAADHETAQQQIKTAESAEESGTAEAKQEREKETGENDSAPRYQDGVNGFAFRLTKEMLEEKEEGENMVLSPYSVWLPLAALANATDEAGREQLLSALGEAGADVAALNEAVKAMNASLMQEEYAAWAKENEIEYEVPLKIANALFLDQDCKAEPKFEEIFKDGYDGKIFSVDFSDASAVEAVNDWASEKTEGKIENIIDSFDPQTVAAIANAIFFSDSWTTEFSEGNTQEDVFHGAKGEETVSFMNQKFTEVQYWESEDMQAVSLGTTSGGQMILLLPGNGKTAEEILASMDAEKLEQLVCAEQNTVQLSLPKFKLESGTFSVKEAMKRLGVPLCDGQRPLLNQLAEGETLLISDAVQKAMVEVDEKGLTAAAVTVMAIARLSLPMEREPVIMKCDRPFAFLLTADGGEQGQIVLFSGIVNQIGEG